MKNLEEQLHMLQKTVMNTEEKGAIRDAVVSYMQENPQKTIAVRNREDRRLQYRTSNFNNSVISFKNMTIAIIIAILLGGGTSFAAENALPGDVLYPIKIHVNENVQELAAVSDKAEAKVQAKLATRRLEEAEKLAVSGRLNAETSADLKTRFEEHSQKSKVSLLKSEEGGKTEADAEVSADFEANLEAHEQILAGIEVSSPQASTHLVGLLGTVRSSLGGISEARVNAEAKLFTPESDVKASAEGALVAAENKINEARKFFESKKGKLSVKAQTDMGARLNVADAMVVEGKAKIEAKAYADAFALFKKAARDAQTAKLFMTTYQELNVIGGNGGVGIIPMPPDEVCPAVRMICPDDTTPKRGPNCEIICGDDTVTEPGSGGGDAGGVAEPDPDSSTVGCTRIYAPVCGINGVTFSNSCSAKAAKVVIAYSGECSDSGGRDIACTMEAKICPDGSAVGRTGPNCEFAECPAPISQGNECRTDSDCDQGYVCLDASPVAQLGVENLRCWKKGMPLPICLAPDTHISTPKGEILVKDVKEGMSVWTVDKTGKKTAVAVALTGHMLAPIGHKVMHIQTIDGHELFVSPGHKVADGRPAGTIKAGDTLGGVKVILAELVPYKDGYTYDILPSGDTGMYFANGILLQSTLK